jgi:hypothetical protein
MALGHYTLVERDSSVLDQGINAVQFSGGALGKALDAVVAAQVEMPDLDNARVCGARGGVNLSLGSFACGYVSHCEDYLGRAEGGEVLGCLIAQADVGTGDDVSPSGAGLAGGEEGEVVLLGGDLVCHGWCWEVN